MRRRDFITLFGGAAAWPLAVHGQQAVRTARIGFLIDPRPDSPQGQADLTALRQGLAELGYDEGRNIVIEQRNADGVIERLPALAAELVRSKVDVIVTVSTPGARAAQQASATIPIVGTTMGDPVEDGLIASLARPGGNLTGNTLLGPELVPKRLGLLKELMPAVSRVAVLWHPGAFSERTTAGMLKGVADAAALLGLQLQLVEARSTDGFEHVFSEMANGRADALLEFPSTMFFVERSRIIELAAQHRLPAMYPAREFVQLGGLIAYGSNILELHRRAAYFIDRILRGSRPADLPVEQPTKFELFINLKTARALGLEVPQSLLSRADEVIE